MRQEFVKEFNFNKQAIEDVDVLKYREEQIKKLKKKCANKEEFAKKLESEFRWQYWSRSEYELIIEITEDNRVLLKPWVGCRDIEKATIDVSDDTGFDWRGFAKEHISKQIYKNKAKVDIFDQICYGNRFEYLVDYLWTTRFKYERKNSKKKGI